MESTQFKILLNYLLYVLLVFAVDSEDVSGNVVDKSIKVDFEDIIVGIGLLANPII